MLRSDFDGHPLWGMLDLVESHVDQIASQGEVAELPDLERIRVQIAHVRGFRELAPAYLQFFAPAMLEQTYVAWTVVQARLAERINNGPVSGAGQVAAGAVEAENALISLAPWPRPYAKGAQVAQMNTLFEGLMEAQRQSIELLVAKHSELAQDVTAFQSEVAGKRDEVIAKAEAVESELSTLDAQITSDKVVVAEAVAGAKVAVAALTDANTEQFAKWKREREATFEQDFDELRVQVTEQLESARDEYAALIGVKEQYEKLVSRIAGDEIAERFRKEAIFGRAWGIVLYIVGALLIAAAALPLVDLLTVDGDDGANLESQQDWNHIAIRVAIGLLAASAATILVRLGSRFLANATTAKRMELELKAIGPFLANVSDPTKIDDAMVDLVDRSFGHEHTPPGAKGKGKPEPLGDGAVPIEVANRLITLAADAVRRAPADTD